MSEPRLVVSVLYRRLSLFEAGIAHEVFGLSRPEIGFPLYRFRMAQGESGDLDAGGGIRLRADGGLRLLDQADMIVIPGWRDHREAPPAPLVKALRRAHRRGARILAICTGAFVLAATGLLDGRRATTHWRYAPALAERFPSITIDADVLYVDDGQLVTTAGSAAGIDACLHIVRQDFGTGIANYIARTMVTPPHRSGGQAQFIASPLPPRAPQGLARVLDWARQRLQDPLTVPQLAAQALMSERTFLRRFRAEIGMTPKSWLVQERVRAAQTLLETSAAGLASIAAESGFESIEAFRVAFRKVAGVAPGQYRKTFRSEERMPFPVQVVDS